MKYVPIAAALAISSIGILLDDLTTLIGLSQGFVETNPIYPYSLFVTPAFYAVFLLCLEKVRSNMIPREYNRYFAVFMCCVGLLAFKGFVSNIFVLQGSSV